MKTKSLFISFVLTLIASSIVLLGGVVVAPAKAWQTRSRSTINESLISTIVHGMSEGKSNSARSSSCCDDPHDIDPTVTDCGSHQWVQHIAICENGKQFTAQRLYCTEGLPEEDCQALKAELEQIQKGLGDLVRPSGFEEERDDLFGIEQGDQCGNAQRVTGVIAGYNDFRSKVCDSLQVVTTIEHLPNGEPLDGTQCGLPRVEDDGFELGGKIGRIFEDADNTKGIIDLMFTGSENAYPRVSNIASLSPPGNISGRDYIVLSTLDQSPEKEKVTAAITPLVDGVQRPEDETKTFEFLFPRSIKIVDEWPLLAQLPPSARVSFRVVGAKRHVDAWAIGSGFAGETFVTKGAAGPANTDARLKIQLPDGGTEPIGGTAPDPAVQGIDFQIVAREDDFNGRVRITGTIVNSGAAFHSSPGQQSVQLYERPLGGDSVLVAQKDFVDLASGDTVYVYWERDWNSSSPAEGEFPPDYLLLINYDPDIYMDGNENNDDSNQDNNRRKRSGQDINQLFDDTR